MEQKKIVYAVFGTGGCGREVMPFTKAYITSRHADLNPADIGLCFVETEPAQDQINGYPCLSEAAFCAMECEAKFYHIAIGNSAARQAVSERLAQFDCRPFSSYAPSAIVYDNNQIGEGAAICDHVMITSNVQIGRFFQANIYSYVTHDCKIGDFVTFAPRVSCNGNVVIEDHAYIGSGAVIRQGTRENPIVIGTGAVVGMGAVVTKSVPPHTTVVGNPAAELKRAPSKPRGTPL
ncbi:Putative acetyltransferase EpsM [Tritonibacter multivorans]|uniref:Putative acetyltransferase EpsM n=1 Tax=Tritonibacter multivorans TaxID=928856 RepID=A0A0P1GGL7_9RHOB|nr:acetyltransferase [Tritonibacter multivorans]MDA7422494.1 acetyltransferase [Tritonibacter multivorans]CUH74832.1 Putative acetyltransferase EpsM [Tritonibacter multivorans]SFD42307.1 hypothetical protein SAMN04488049_11311 [Tritonibacter multivorans]